MSDTLPNSSSLAKRLLNDGFNPSGREISKGEALIWATEQGNMELVQLLVDAGVDVNYNGGSRTDTASHYAARKELCDILILLHKAGAVMDARDMYGLSPLHCAAYEGCYEAAQLIGTTFGIDVNCQDTYGLAPLHAAAKGNKCNVIKLLLNELGADIRCRDKRGLTALHHACVRGCIEATKLLVDLGSDISWTTNNGQTPLHIITHDNELSPNLPEIV